MSIASKITSIEGHITDIYDTMALGGDTTTNKNITNINAEIKREYKDFLANGTDVLWNNWEKVNGTGEALSLNQTIEGRLQSVLKGNTSQETTTGANLQKYDIRTNTSGGVAYTCDEKGQITMKNTSTTSGSFAVNQSGNEIELGAGTYIVKAIGNLGNVSKIRLILNGSNSDKTLNSNNEVSFTLTETTSYRCAIVREDTITYNANFYLTLAKDTATTERYTNGASPNPSYPQDIHVVSGDNSVVVRGKNLFNKDDVVVGYLKTNGTINGTSGTHTSNYILIEPNTNYIRTTRESVAYYDKNKTFISYAMTTSITTPANAKYFRMTVLDNNLDTEQLVLGDTAPTTYTPYQSTTYPISLGTLELCKIGDYQDYIYKDNGKWYKYGMIGKVVLDGSESWNLSSASPQRFIYNFGGGYSDATKILILSNYFKGIKFNDRNNVDYPSIYLENGYIGCNNTGIDTSVNFTTWLSNNNTKVYYVASSPTTTEITDTTLQEQLNNIYKAQSQNEQTNISQTNNDKPFIIDAWALLDDIDS